ncbi:unnamed protein product [Rotaria socialis]|uniref:Uncharacterized protein n=1 Tax=Rotaria socialis TaxID=392032 RepID=A0A817VFA5_9BILA|nr:unnamed protein product [Rotaria socialis]
MVQLQRTTQETSHRKIFNQAGGQAKASQMSSTTEKPKRKTTDENFDTTQRKRPKQFEPSSNHTSSIRFDVLTNPVSLAKGSQRTQINTAQFSTYRARRPHGTVDTAQIRKQRKNVLQKQQINVMQAPQVNDYDDDGENELTTQNALNNYDDDDNEDEQLTETMTQPQNRLSHPRNTRQRSYELIDEADDSESIKERENDLAQTTNTIAGNVQIQLNKLDKQLKSLSKAVQDYSVNPTLIPYQNLTYTYPKTVPFRGINLLTASKATDYKKYTRTILKLLFSSKELSESILISNPLYTRPVLDPERMATWSEAVGARFKIDPDRFDDFFRTCLRRTLAQMLCDVRRATRNSANFVAEQLQGDEIEGAEVVGNPTSDSTVSGCRDSNSGGGMENRNL